eukprot:1142847-Karenia_brevis.AAC.1
MMVGTNYVDSKARKGERVRDCEASASFWYQDFVTMQSLAHPGPQNDCIKWITERDRQSRVKARALHLDGWPWGEALVQ